EAAFDQPAAPELLQRLVDLAEVERPGGTDAVLEDAFDAVTVELLPVEQAQDRVSQQHAGSYLGRRRQNTRGLERGDSLCEAPRLSTKSVRLRLDRVDIYPGLGQS